LIKRLLIAIQFLTIVPIRISASVRDQDLAGSMAWYPLVGLAVGAASAMMFIGTARLFSWGIAVVSALIVGIGLSGALHLDGFADLCDGFYAGKTKERTLEIMKDSHAGAMAIVGIVCLLAMKITFLVNFDRSRIIPALLLSPVLGRCSMVWLAATSVYARSGEGTGSPYIGHVSRSTFWVAILMGLGIACAVEGARGIVAGVGAALFTAGFRRWVVRRIGGMTGDTLGACSEVVEVLVLALLSATWPTTL
jgi:adenosylcobinamide-GDP ribazoletransferase